VTEIRASSPEVSREGLGRATKTLRGISGVEITKKRVKVKDGKLVEYRVDMKIVFILE
jgi:flavin-binding protein dodecin